MPNGSLLNSNSEGRHVEESSDILQSDDNILLNASAVEEIANDDNEGLHQEDNATSGQTRALSASVINLPHAINVPTYQVAWAVGPVPGQQSIIVANEVVTRRHTFAPRRTKRCMSFDPDNPDMVCGVRGCPGANKRQNCVTPKHLYRHRDLLAINP